MNHPQPPIPPQQRRPPRPTPQRKRKKSLVVPIILLGLFGMFILFVGVMVYFISSFSSFSSDKPVNVSQDSVLRVSLMGSISEYKPPTAGELLFNDISTHFHEYIRAVERAATDDKIKGIWLEVGANTMGWSQAKEMRTALQEFRNSGKWILAHGEFWQEKSYYIASVADEVYLVPEAYLLFDGFSSERTFYGDFFRRFGINVHVEAFGEYKNFADPYRYNKMSDAQRESTEVLLSGISSHLIDAILASRDITKEALTEYMSKPLGDIEKAVEIGLLDGAIYEDDLMAKMAERVGKEDPDDLRFVWEENYARKYRSSGGFGSGGKVAVIYASGAIQSGWASTGAFGDNVIASDRFIDTLKDARKNSNVKAIVLRIDSPGGSALASDVMWKEIRRTSEEYGIPVVASMGNVAASGGYYMAMAADKIVASPMTITGSIGVVAMRVDFEGLYNDYNLHVDVVKTAPSADFFNVSRQLTQQEIDVFHERTYQSYRRFVTKASQSRGVEYDDFEQFARGRVWLGTDALQHNLVDELGELDRAIELAAELAELSDYRTAIFPRQGDPWEMLRNQATGRSQVKLDKFRAFVPEHLRKFYDIKASEPNSPVHIWAVMPYALEFNE
jgi:protease-4